MFIASCSFLRGRCWRRRPAWRGVAWGEERQLLARLVGFLVWLLARRRAGWRVVGMTRLERDRRSPAKTLKGGDHREDLLIGEADRGLIDGRHSRVEARDDVGVGCVQRLREVLDIVQARDARGRARRDAIEVRKTERP